MLRTALTLARKGIHVFPCMVRSKAPACQHGFLDASVDPTVIKDWWRHDPNFNIGIRTGTSSKLFAVDVDGFDAEMALAALEREHGDLTPTVETITARGRHVYFRMPPATVPCSNGKIAAGIDVKADGGYVLAPPSLHPSGKRYCWSVDSASDLASAPEWLLRIVVEDKPRSAAAPVEQWRDIATGGVSEGARNATAAKLTGYLLRRFIDPFVALELLQAWNATRCTPPLPPTDIERIVASIASKELKRRNPHG